MYILPLSVFILSVFEFYKKCNNSEVTQDKFMKLVRTIVYIVYIIIKCMYYLKRFITRSRFILKHKMSN